MAKGQSVRTGLGIALLIGMIVLAVRTIDLHKVLETMRSASPGYVIGAGLLAVTVCMLACSARLFLLTEPLPHTKSAVSFWQLTSIYYASSAAHHVLPAPAAEVLRTVHLQRRYGYRLGALIACQWVEKLIDSLGLGIETLLVALFLPLPQNVRDGLLWFGAITALGILAAFAIARTHTPASIARAHTSTGRPTTTGPFAQMKNIFAQLAEGFYLLRSPRTWLLSLLFSIINDLANAASVGLCLLAVGVSLPIGTWFLLVLVARLAGLLPSTPGQFGVIEAGMVATMGAFGVALPTALAVALTYHLAHFIPVVLVGLFEFRRQWTSGDTSAETPA